MVIRLTVFVLSKFNCIFVINKAHSINYYKTTNVFFNMLDYLLTSIVFSKIYSINYYKTTNDFNMMDHQLTSIIHILKKS